MMHSKINIIGCGLSGMITALSLAKRGINSTIIEKNNVNDPSFFNDVRTTAITSSSKYFFQSIGIWTEIEQYVGAINEIYVADNKSELMIHFSSHMLENEEIMGYIVENKDFKKCLLELARANSYIKIIDNSSYELVENNDHECVIVVNESIKLNSDLLIVCDGSNSVIRQKYFTPKFEKTYKQNALTFIVGHENNHEGTAVEHFMPLGPFAILPLKDQHLSSVVWTIDSAMNNAILNLSEEEFLYLVQENFGKFLGNIAIKSKIASFPLKAYVTDKYYNNKIVLVADCAHIIHPLAGQGLNQGIKDIEALISNIFKFGINDISLENYQNERERDNAAMFEITDTLNAIFSNNSKILHLARQLGFSAIENISPLKKLFIKYAMGKR